MKNILKILLLTIIIIVTTTNVIASANFTTNLYAWFPLNETSTSEAKDHSGNSRNLTLVGTVQSQDGIVTNARGGYSGSDYFYEAGYLSRVVNEPYTINTWIKINETINTSKTYGITGMGTPWSAGYTQLRVGYSGTNSKFEVTEALYASTTCDVGPAFVMTPYEWTMITITRTATDLYFYINGNLTNSTSCSLSNNFNNNLCIGSYECNAAQADQMFIDEYAFWDNRVLNSSDITELYNSGNGLTYPIADTSSVSSLQFVPSNPIMGQTVQCNYSFTNSTGGSGNDNSNITFYRNDIFIKTIQLSLNESVELLSDEYIAGDNITCTVTPFDGIAIGTNVSVEVTAALYNGTSWGFPSQVTNFENTTFTLNLTNVPGEVTGISNITFGFNNTVYQATWNLGTNGLNMSANILIPNVTSQTNFNFNFTISSTHQNGSHTSSFTNTTTASFFDLDDCSTYKIPILNFTFYNETSGSLTNADLSVYTMVSFNFTSLPQSFNFTDTNTNTFSICMTPNYTQGRLDLQMEYSGTGFSEKTYYLDDYSFSNATSNISLFLTDSTSSVTFTVTDYTDSPVAGTFIKVLSYDLGSNTYETTEILKTDSQGQAIGQLVLNTAWYAFIVEFEGEVKLETLPSKITGTSLTLRINLDTDYFITYDNVFDISHSLSFTNSTTTFHFVYSDPSGDVQQGCLEVTRQGLTSESTICNTCTTSSAATILCAITEDVGSNTYVAVSSVVIGNERITLESKSVSFFVELHQTFQENGILVSFFVILFLALLGAWNPGATLIFVGAGYVGLRVLGLFYLDWPFLVGGLIVIAISLFRSKES